jgi:hypothetical protein
MKTFTSRLRSFHFPWYTSPILIVLVGLLAYGLLIREMGFYWDDWVFIWMAKTTGPAGLARYFSTNRPFWGAIIAQTTALLGSSPWQWQIFGLFWRVAAAISLWGLVLLVWPRQNRAALWVSLLFLVYPGFSMQFIAINMGHFFLVLTSFLLSLCLTVLALRGRKWSWLLHIPALLLAAVNLLAMEYFFLLELIRPVIIWFTLSRRYAHPRQRMARTLLHSLPYLLLFLGVTYWRFFVFSYQTRYPLTLISDFRTAPLSASFKYLGVVTQSVWTVLVPGWLMAFQIPDITQLGKLTAIFTAGVFLLALILLGLYFWRSRIGAEEETLSSKWPAQFLLIGIVLLVLGSIPFWITGLPILLGFPSNRFIIPSIPGAAFILAALFGFLARLPGKWYRLADILLVILVAASISQQFQTANGFRRDWDLQTRFLQQLTERIPALQRGTLVLSSDLPSHNVSDNSITAPANWIYAPEYRGGSLPYMLYFPSVRLGKSLAALQKGVALEEDYLVARYFGNTAAAIALYYNPPGCLRVLDPEIDSLDRTIPVTMREAARLTDLNRIIDAPQAILPEGIFKKAAGIGWCDYYEKAALAAQTSDWAKVTSLAESAFALGDTPSDPAERFPFIEGFAHTGDWSRALELTRDSAAVTNLIHPSLCALWQRIARTTPDTTDRSGTLIQVQNLLEACTIP